MARGRFPTLTALLALAFTAASVTTPYAQEPSEGPGNPTRLPTNPFCLAGGCGFGRDGIPEAYAGSGLTGRAARAYTEAGLKSFAAANTSLRSWLSSADMAGAPMPVSDVWGYTSPKGREYALVGLRQGTAFVEITDPSEPEVVAFVPGAASHWRDMAVYRRTAYSVNEGGRGIQVIDLRGIDRGEVTLVQELTDGGLQTVHNIFVNEDSGYAYLLGANVHRGGLVAVDLSSPRQPVLEPINWEATYVHDVQVVSYTQGKYAGREIAFAFTASLGLHIIDVTDKRAPFTVSHLKYDNATYGHSGWLSPDRRFLYLNDELDERVNSDVGSTTTYVIRVGNLANPRLVEVFDWGTPFIDHNSMARGDRLFVAAYQGGLQILDISRPRAPAVRGFFDTHPEGEGAKFTGAWGVFADFPSGSVVVSDIERGLFVIRAE